MDFYTSMWTALISISGAVANILSFIYFINRAQKNLGNGLLMLLNLLDTMLCLTATALSFQNNDHDPTTPDVTRTAGDVTMATLTVPISQKVLHSAYGSLIEGTAFATCLLAVARAICLCHPFYSPSRRGIVVSALAFYSYTVLQEYYFCSALGEEQWLEFISLRLGKLGAMVLVVAVLSVVSLVKLVWSVNQEGEKRITDRNKRASVTVLLLSLLFVLFNLDYGVSMAVRWYVGPAAIGRFWYNFGKHLAIPLNSALNPIVYFCRKQRMREYVNDKLGQSIKYDSSDDLNKVEIRYARTRNYGR